MDKEKNIFEDTKPANTPHELLDCFSELLAYTGYLIRQDTGNDKVEATAETFHALVERSQGQALAAGFTEEDWNKGFFPVCAYIDEALICLKFEKFQKWEKAQLQRKYFNTTNAGTEFYNRLENLEISEKEIKKIYEVCLALGFRGSYYHTSDKGKLEDIRYTCLKDITENTSLQYPGSFFPEAYEKNSTRSLKRKKWRGFSFFSVIAFLFPVILFAALYFFFDFYLDDMVKNYFKKGF